MPNSTTIYTESDRTILKYMSFLRLDISALGSKHQTCRARSMEEFLDKPPESGAGLTNEHLF